MTIIKMSKRTIRQQCETCGSNDLYWGKRGNDWVLIDANAFTRSVSYKGHVPERHLHVHQPKPKAEAEVHPERKAIIEEKAEKVYTEAKRKQTEIERGEEGIYEEAPFTLSSKAEPSPWTQLPEPKEQEAVPVAVGGAKHSAEMENLLEMLRKLLGQPQIDRTEVEKIAREVIRDVVFPTKTVVVDPKGRKVKEIGGHTHRELERVIRATRTRHVFLVGPAGTGKSTIAEQVAEGLDLPFGSISLTQQTPEIALRGFVDANGKYHRTAFLDLFENGGVFCIDEVDHGHPNTVGVMNAALSNGQMFFPGYGMVKRHKDFRCIATANTYGRGASREYVGATQLDAASIDRFAFMTVDVDEALETSMVSATGVDASTQEKILEYVKRLRRNRESTGARVVISPRASVGIAQFLLDGFTFDEAVDCNIRKGTSDDVWAKLTA